MLHKEEAEIRAEEHAERDALEENACSAAHEREDHSQMASDVVDAAKSLDQAGMIKEMAAARSPSLASVAASCAPSSVSHVTPRVALELQLGTDAVPSGVEQPMQKE